MDHFAYSDGRLTCEHTPLTELVQRFGTPLYVYSAATLRAHYRRLAEAFAPLAPLICFSVKCCPNVHICRLLAEEGSGFDVVSGGELCRALQCGADPARIVFAGVGKSDQELREALAARIALVNVESESELQRLCDLACESGVRQDVAVRVNPDVDAGAHRHTTTGTAETKFGVGIDEAARLFERYGAAGAVNLRGLHVHIGSPIEQLSAYRVAIERVIGLTERLRSAARAGQQARPHPVDPGHSGPSEARQWLRHRRRTTPAVSRVDTLDIGGGFSAYYQGEESPQPGDYAEVAVPLLQGRGLRVVLEPGRVIAANAGLLLTRVLHIKQGRRTRFVVVDASMNELIRPALYDAYHFIWPVQAGGRTPRDRGLDQPFHDLVESDVVGPVCENSDFLARGRRIPPVERSDLLAVFGAGAYAMSMASQYNSRPRAAEVLVDGGEARLIRRRETYQDLLGPERTGRER